MYAVAPSWRPSHLQHRHKEDHDDYRRQSGAANVARELLPWIDMPLLDPRRDAITLPVPDSDPVPSLEVKTGNKCLECLKILTDTRRIVKHLREAHNIVRRGPGRPSIAFRMLPPDWTTISCQRFLWPSTRASTSKSSLLRKQSNAGQIPSERTVLQI